METRGLKFSMKIENFDRDWKFRAGIEIFDRDLIFSIAGPSGKFLVERESCVPVCRFYITVEVAFFIPGNLIWIAVTVLATAKCSRNLICNDCGWDGRCPRMDALFHVQGWPFLLLLWGCGADLRNLPQWFLPLRWLAAFFFEKMTCGNWGGVLWTSRPHPDSKSLTWGLLLDSQSLCPCLRPSLVILRLFCCQLQGLPLQLALHLHFACLRAAESPKVVMFFFPYNPLRKRQRNTVSRGVYNFSLDLERQVTQSQFAA